MVDRAVVFADMVKIKQQFGSVGDGSYLDRAAQLLSQTFDVLGRRPDQPTILKMLYLENEVALRMLPEAMVCIVRKLCDGTLDVSAARAELHSLKEEYRRCFSELDVRPTRQSILFFKT